MFTLIERLQAKKYRTGVRRIGELQRVKSWKRHRIIHAFSVHPDFAHFTDDRVGAGQRRTFRHFHAANQVELVLGGNKPARHGFKHHPGGAEQQQVNNKHGATSSERFANQPLVTVRAAMEKAVKRAEQPAEQAIDKPGREISWRAVRLQQQGRQRRGEGQRVDGRDHRRNRDRHRKLFIELPGYAGEEGHRYEHRAQHQGDGDNRPGNFTHRLVRRLQRGEPLLDIALDVFHHHNRVVHHDPNGENQTEQAQGVKREAKQIENTERPHHRDRYGNQWNNRCAPGLQEQDHHQYHQHYRFEQGLHHRANRVAHKNGGVVRGGPLHVFRETRGQFVHFGAYRIRQINGVGSRRLEDADPDRIFIVKLGT